MIPCELDRRQPELAVLPITPNVDVHGLVAVETVEKEPVGSRNARDLAVIDQHMYGLALLGAVLTIVALYYYLVLGRRMYIDPPVTPDLVVLAAPLFAAILVCTVGGC
jgi:hypothetical protein